MKNKKIHSLVVLVLCFLLCLAPIQYANAIASAVILDKTSVTMEVGEKETVKMLIRNYPANAAGWSSSNTAVATVSKGVITAKKAGTANIICNTGYGYNLTCKVTVKNAASGTESNSSSSKSETTKKAVDLSKYVTGNYTKLLKKVPYAKKLSAAEDPAGIGNAYVFKVNKGTSLFFRFDPTTKKILTLQNSQYKNLTYAGVKLGMKTSKAKAAMKAKKWTLSKTQKLSDGSNLIYKKNNRTFTIRIRKGCVDFFTWNAS